MNWQQHVNEGDYHGALQSQGCPSFTPGDGSWSDFLFRLMHHREHPPMPEDVFLQKVADCFLTCEEQQDVYWRCYVSICRYYQQPVQPCVFYTDFVKQAPQEYAREMAKRGDVEGLDIVSHHFGLQPSWDFIDLLPCTLKPRLYLHLIPWNDVDIEERLVTHIQRRFHHTGQVLQSLYMIDKAFQYLSSNGDFPELQQLKEEYKKLIINREVVQTEQQEDGNNVSESSLPTTNITPETAAFSLKRHRRFDRHTIHLEESCKMWQQAACHAQQEAETLGRECSALQERVAFLESSVSGVNTVADTLDSFVKEYTKSNTCNDNVVDFLQGLHGCLQSLGDDSEFVPSEVVSTKQTLQIERLKDVATKVQSRMVESSFETKEMTCEVTSEDVNQVSFSSMMDESSTEPPNDNDEIQQLEQIVQSLEKQLEQQQYEHDMECTSDKARIEYLLELLDETSKTTMARCVSPTATNDKLVLALEVSEERRTRAVEELQRERELYEEKMKQLTLAAREMETQRGPYNCRG